MINQEILQALLDSLVDPVVFVDTEHVIQFMNTSAIKRYEKRGGKNLIGKSIFSCHNEQSQQKMLQIFQSFFKDEEEQFLVINKEKQKTYMRAVRNQQGDLIGYYERFEKQ
jgi:transcriptional regulator with PAS, ATPase and Fis domain